MAVKTLKRGIFQRIFGICATKPPADDGCWSVSGGKIAIDLDRAAELSGTGGAIRLEGKALPEKVLVVHGDDGAYHAFHNKCQHMGRRLDPVPEAGTVQCCSVNKTTYEYDGKPVFGPAKGPLKTYPVAVEENRLIVTLA